MTPHPGSVEDGAERSEGQRPESVLDGESIGTEKRGRPARSRTNIAGFSQRRNCPSRKQEREQTVSRQELAPSLLQESGPPWCGLGREQGVLLCEESRATVSWESKTSSERWQHTCWTGVHSGLALHGPCSTIWLSNGKNSTQRVRRISPSDQPVGIRVTCKETASVYNSCSDLNYFSRIFLRVSLEGKERDCAPNYFLLCFRQTLIAMPLGGGFLIFNWKQPD